jgi:hypothetical protein
VLIGSVDESELLDRVDADADEANDSGNTIG